MVVWISLQKAHLAWETVLTGRTRTAPSRLHVYVDALDGALLATTDEVVAGTGKSEWNGPGPLQINTAGSGTAYSLNDQTRPGLACGDFATQQVMTGTDDAWGSGRAQDKETGCVDALYAGQKQWDMLRDWLDRDGLDGEGGGWPVYVGLDAANAYWNGSSVSIGHNARSQWAGSLDVVGHEYGHGIDSTTPGGAASEAGLGEATGDIFGALTEAYTNEPSPFDTPDFLVGETANLGGRGPVRNMYTPAALGDPECYSDAIPGTEPHKAAGPMNHWFYLLAEGSAPTAQVPSGSPTCNRTPVLGIGIQKAGQVFYGAMLLKTSNMTHRDYRAATLTAARSIDPTCGLFYRTAAAWDAINVPKPRGEDCDLPGPSWFLQLDPKHGTVAPGRSTTSTIKTIYAGRSGPVLLKTSGAPDGVSVTLDPTTVSVGQNSTMTVATSTSVKPGTYPIQVGGINGDMDAGATYTLTVPAPPPCSTQDAVLNGGFELASSSGWSASKGVIDSSVQPPAHSGTWKAWFNGYGRLHGDNATQRVFIPAVTPGCAKRTLAFYLHINTAEGGTAAYDRFTVAVGGKQLAMYSNLDADPGFTLKSFDVSAYAGQTVALTFTGIEDHHLQTSFVVDDITLQAS